MNLHKLSSMMSFEEKRWMDHLCSLIQAEQDPHQFAVLISAANLSALNQYLEKREFLLKKRSEKDALRLNRDPQKQAA
jgi:hypothetical protein